LAARITLGAAQPELRRTPLDILLGRWTLNHSPAFIAMDLLARLFSSYDIGPRATKRCAALRKVGFNIEEDGVVAKITAQSATHPH
jgi:hypothetical protein